MNNFYFSTNYADKQKIQDSFNGMYIGKNDMHGKPVTVGSKISFKSDNVIGSNMGIVSYHLSDCSFVALINTPTLINGYVKLDSDLYDVQVIENNAD